MLICNLGQVRKDAGACSERSMAGNMGQIRPPGAASERTWKNACVPCLQCAPRLLQ